jgi:GDP-L-fucose synthase
MDKDAKIFVAGHRGLVGSAIVRKLEADGYSNIILRTHAELDLSRQADTEAFFEQERPDYVFLAAAKVGGILANSSAPADFIYLNTEIAFNVIHSAYKYGITKLLNLGSSCIYPKFAPQPIHENDLLTGELEVTNEAYAVAKIAALKLCRHYNDQYGLNFISAMPTNLYGPNDNFDLESSHVLPAMIRKFHDAKVEGRPEVILWGTGTPRREFLHVDDLAAALVFLMDHCDYEDIGEIVNVGTGEDVTIKELAEMVQAAVGFEGDITWDTSKPDGTPRKLLDVSRLHDLGWTHMISLDDGISDAYAWFVEHYG